MAVCKGGYSMNCFNTIKSFIVFLLMISTVTVCAQQGQFKKPTVHGKPCSIVRVYKHDTALSKKYVFHFSGNPICTYIPKKIDEAKVAKGEPVTLAFFVPLATIKAGVAKDAIDRINTEPCGVDHCVRVRMVNAPMKGIQYDITLNLNKRALEYQSLTSITGERGVMFKLNDQEALKKVNRTTASNKIRRLAMVERPTVVLDFGHGGKDPGFIRGDLREKDVNLAIGQILTSELKKKGYQVCLTRKGDEYLALDQRTASAGKCKGAQALISIHANSAPHSDRASGIETFCHKHSFFKNEFNKGNEQLLAHATQIDQSSIERSNQLAKLIQNQVINHAKTKKADVVDRGVKHNIFQMLLGSDVPSVLLELGFLTNQKEAALLQDSAYQKTLAKGICKGLDDFFNVM